MGEKQEKIEQLSVCCGAPLIRDRLAEFLATCAKCKQVHELAMNCEFELSGKVIKEGKITSSD